MVAWYLRRPKLGAGDLIHHTRDGYEWIADRFLEALEALEADPRLASPP